MALGGEERKSGPRRAETSAALSSSLLQQEALERCVGRRGNRGERPSCSASRGCSECPDSLPAQPATRPCDARARARGSLPPCHIAGHLGGAAAPKAVACTAAAGAAGSGSSRLPVRLAKARNAPPGGTCAALCNSAKCAPGGAGATQAAAAFPASPPLSTCGSFSPRWVFPQIPSLRRRGFPGFARVGIRPGRLGAWIPTWRVLSVCVFTRQAASWESCSVAAPMRNFSARSSLLAAGAAAAAAAASPWLRKVSGGSGSCACVGAMQVAGGGRRGS
ncbi:Hypothetical predicted protein [Podarcis lilfordi]|uniref:Uncharacterized protein n=1 Tax=Podarcis lilfordi TaxID=74358 RepID=A0AA35PGL8_9SAUR|nr:Hypothetical predicted protein [Podarcis lilfordi]